MSDSLRPHGLQHARPPCPSPTPGACSNSCPLSRCRHPAISSSWIGTKCVVQGKMATLSVLQRPPLWQGCNSGADSQAVLRPGIQEVLNKHELLLLSCHCVISPSRLNSRLTFQHTEQSPFFCSSLCDDRPGQSSAPHWWAPAP